MLSNIDLFSLLNVVLEKNNYLELNQLSMVIIKQEIKCIGFKNPANITQRCDEAL